MGQNFHICLRSGPRGLTSPHLTVSLTIKKNLDNLNKVNTADGPVRGGWLKSTAGAQIASFQGIPFAAPPLGSLRFSLQ